MTDDSSAAGQLAALARSVVEEITAVKAAGLARQLARDPGTMALAAPAPPPGTEPDLSLYYYTRGGWHPTLADPAHRSYLLGHPGNRSYTLGWQVEQAAGRPVAQAHDPSAARPAAAPARRRRRRW